MLQYQARKKVQALSRESGTFLPKHIDLQRGREYAPADMELASLSVDTLRELLKLTEEKERIAIEIANIDAKIVNIVSGTPRPATPKPARLEKIAKPAKQVRKEKRANLSGGILDALKQAGEAGVTISEIAKKSGLKPQSINVWINTTGKKYPEVKRVGRGCYSWQSVAPSAVPQTAPEPPAPGYSETPAS